MFLAIDRRLFAALAAPDLLPGWEYGLSVAVARWAFLLAPGVLVLLWITGRSLDRRAAVSATLTAVIGLIVAHVVSSIIVTPRPFMDSGAANLLDHAADGGMPSDHCTLLFCLAFGLWATRPATWPNLWIALAGLGLAVGWSRVFLGAHYPSDILGAAVLAAVSAVLFACPWGRAVVVTLTHWFDTLSRRIEAWVAPFLPRADRKVDGS